MNSKQMNAYLHALIAPMFACFALNLFNYYGIFCLFLAANVKCDAMKACEMKTPQHIPLELSLNKYIRTEVSSNSSIKGIFFK